MNNPWSPWTRSTMCRFSFTFSGKAVKPLVWGHRHDTNFTVTCNHPGCEVSFSKYTSFKQHVYRKHRHDDPTPSQTQWCTDDSTPDDPAIGTTTTARHASDAAFVLKLWAKYHLGCNAVADIVNSVRYICEDQLELQIHQEGSINPTTFASGLLQRIDTEAKTLVMLVPNLLC